MTLTADTHAHHEAALNRLRRLIPWKTDFCVARVPVMVSRQALLSDRDFERQERRHAAAEQFDRDSTRPPGRDALQALSELAAHIDTQTAGLDENPLLRWTHVPQGQLRFSEMIDDTALLLGGSRGLLQLLADVAASGQDRTVTLGQDASDALNRDVLPFRQNWNQKDLPWNAAPVPAEESGPCLIGDSLNSRGAALTLTVQVAGHLKLPEGELPEGELPLISLRFETGPGDGSRQSENEDAPHRCQTPAFTLATWQAACQARKVIDARSGPRHTWPERTLRAATGMYPRMFPTREDALLNLMWSAPNGWKDRQLQGDTLRHQRYPHFWNPLTPSPVSGKGWCAGDLGGPYNSDGTLGVLEALIQGGPASCSRAWAEPMAELCALMLTRGAELTAGQAGKLTALHRELNRHHRLDRSEPELDTPVCSPVRVAVREITAHAPSPARGLNALLRRKFERSCVPDDALDCLIWTLRRPAPATAPPAPVAERNLSVNLEGTRALHDALTRAAALTLGEALDVDPGDSWHLHPWSARKDAAPLPDAPEARAWNPDRGQTAHRSSGTPLDRGTYQEDSRLRLRVHHGQGGLSLTWKDVPALARAQVMRGLAVQGDAPDPERVFLTRAHPLDVWLAALNKTPDRA